MTNQERSGHLIAVAQYFRHGHRTPIFHYPEDPHGEEAYWPLEESVLTNKGKQQMYELGQFTRERYKHFLPGLFPNKNFLVYTTNKPRTIQSAQVYSAGLFPPTKEDIWNENIQWTPIPTYVADEYLFRSDISSVSPAWDREFKKAMNEHLEVFKKDPESEFIHRKSGVELKDYLDFTYLFDTLTIQESLGLKLPDWTKKVYPNTKFHLDYLECITKTDQMKRLFVGPQLYEIIQYFEKMIKDPTSGPKLLSFSGHDVNIAGVLNTFGAFERHLPIYASSIFIELKQNHGQYYINVFYKKEDVVPIRILGTDFDCKFENFKELLSVYAINKEQFFEEF